MRRAEPTAFRVRLLRILAPAMVAALSLLCFLVWMAAYAGFVGRAEEALEAEITDIAFVIGGSDSLRIGHYRWDEPHHVTSDPALDPVFVEVFEPRGSLVWQSPNGSNTAGALPGRVVIPRPPILGMIPRLTIHGMGPFRAYVASGPIPGRDGQVLGTVQVSRFVPPEWDYLGHLRGYLIVLLAVFAALLISVIHGATRRVMGPIEHIAAFAADLGPDRLDSRVPLRPDFDRETVVLAGAINGLLDRLEAAVVSMHDFTANAAHELRTPLSVLHGHVELALRRERSSAEYRETLHLVDAQLDRLTRMVGAMLSLSRLDASQPLELEDVNLAILLQEAVDRAQPMAAARGVGIAVRRNDHAWVKGHNDLLFQALVIALDNAIQYGEGGDIDCSVTTVPGAVQVVIRDHGPGIPPDEVERVFERFVRGTAGRESGTRGSGLGLALLEAVVARHGGTCALENADPGLRVVIRLPA